MLARLSVKKPYTVIVGVIIVLIMGYMAFTKLSTDLLPSMNLPYAIVMTTYVGATPEEVEEVVKARLDEIFGEIRKKLKSAKYDQRLPEGIILVGGGAKMRDIDLFAKKSLEAAVKIGTPQGLGGVADAIEKPEFATAVGLAMFAAEESQYAPVGGKKAKKALKMPKTPGFLKKLFSKF